MFFCYEQKRVLKIIGKNIQNQRKLKGYSQESFAELMGVSWSYVSKIECGILNLSLGKIYDIANYLKINTDELTKIK